MANKKMGADNGPPLFNRYNPVFTFISTLSFTFDVFLKLLKL